MGDLVRRVQLSRLDTEGNPGEPRTYLALIDTGSTATVVPRRVLRELRASSVGTTHLYRRRYPTVLLAVRLDGEGCMETPILAVVSDAHARKAQPDAEIILGHDYLQREQAVLAYTPKHKVACVAGRRRHRYQPRE